MSTLDNLYFTVFAIIYLLSFDEIKVDEVLNIVVFGESLLNDGVAVVLYHMFESFCKIGLDKVSAEDVGKGIGSFGVVAGGGVLIGILTGYICAFMTRNIMIFFCNHVNFD